MPAGSAPRRPWSWWHFASAFAALAVALGAVAWTQAPRIAPSWVLAWTRDADWIVIAGACAGRASTDVTMLLEDRVIVAEPWDLSGVVDRRLGDRDMRVVRMALGLSVLSGSAARGPAVERFLRHDDDEARALAWEAVIAWGGTSAADAALAEAIADRSAEVRLVAARYLSLERAASQAAAGDVLFAGTVPEHRRLALLAAFVHAWPGLDAKLRSAAVDGDGTVAAAAIRLIALDDGAAAAALLRMRWDRERDQGERWRLLEAACDADPWDASGFVEAGLRDADWSYATARAAVARELPFPAPAVAALAAAVAADDRAERERFAEAIARAAEREPAKPLLDRPMSMPWTGDALLAIGRGLRADAVPTLLAALRRDELADEAARALGEAGEPLAIDPLLDALRGRPTAFWGALDGLGRMGDRHAVAGMLAFLAEAGGASGDVVARIDPACDLLDPSAVEALLAHEQPAVVSAACRWLGELRGAAARPALEALLEDRRDGVVDAAAAALLRAGGRADDICERVRLDLLAPATLALMPPTATGATRDLLAPIAAASGDHGDAVLRGIAVSRDRTWMPLLRSIVDIRRPASLLAFGRCGSADDAGVLRAMRLAHDSPDGHLLEALAMLGAGDGEAALALALHETPGADEAQRCAALRALVVVSPESAADASRRLLGARTSVLEPGPESRRRALDDVGVPRRAFSGRWVRRQWPALAGEALRTLVRHAPAAEAEAAARRALLPGLPHALREAAIAALHAIGSAEARAAVADLTADPDLRHVVRRTLARWDARPTGDDGAVDAARPAGG